MKEKLTEQGRKWRESGEFAFVFTHFLVICDNYLIKWNLAGGALHDTVANHPKANKSFRWWRERLLACLLESCMLWMPSGTSNAAEVIHGQLCGMGISSGQTLCILGSLDKFYRNLDICVRLEMFSIIVLNKMLCWTEDSDFMKRYFFPIRESASFFSPHEHSIHDKCL